MPRTRTAESKPAATRKYIVIDKATGKPAALIEAVSIAQTRNHVADEQWVIRCAEQDDMFAAAKAGLEIVKAKASTAEAE